MRLQNDFSWSFSRANTFSECQKKYWYIYYGAWEGWPKTPWDERAYIDPLASYLYAFKQMQRLPTFVGTVVHNTIEQFLKRREPIVLSEQQVHAQKLFEKGIDEAKGLSWKKDPKRITCLSEYYYGSPPTKDELDAAKAKIETSLAHWHSSPIVSELLFHAQTEQISVEELAHFQLLDRYKIIVVIDLALSWKKRDGSKNYILFDWKTGEESAKTEKQLYTYALFATKVWKASLDQIILVPFYLFKNRYQKITSLDSATLETVEKDIEDSCKALHLVHQKDVQEFAYTEDRSVCQACPFNELCTKAEYKNMSHEALKILVNK